MVAQRVVDRFLVARHGSRLTGVSRASERALVSMYSTSGLVAMVGVGVWVTGSGSRMASSAARSRASRPWPSPTDGRELRTGSTLPHGLAEEHSAVTDIRSSAKSVRKRRAGGGVHVPSVGRRPRPSTPGSSRLARHLDPLPGDPDRTPTWLTSPDVLYIETSARRRPAHARSSREPCLATRNPLDNGWPPQTGAQTRLERLVTVADAGPGFALSFRSAAGAALMPAA